MEQFSHIESEIEARYPESFKQFVKSLGKQVRFTAVNETFLLLNFLGNVHEDKYDDPIWISKELSDRYISYQEETEGTIVMPFARGTSGDRFDYLYFIQQPGELEASPAVYYRNSDRFYYARIKIGNDLQLFTGKYPTIPLIANEIEFESGVSTFLSGLEIPKYIALFGEDPYFNGSGYHEEHSVTSSDWLDDQWKVDFYVNVVKHEQPELDFVVFNVCSMIPWMGKKLYTCVPFRDVKSEHAYSFENNLVHNTYPLKRLLILASLKKQMDYLASKEELDSNAILSFMDSHSLHAICKQIPTDVAISRIR